jgi:hypothetical protein
LEVRRRGGGHPLVTERERVIRLNGTGGVKILDEAWIELSIQAFSLLESNRSTLNVQHPTFQFGVDFS